MKFYGAAVLLTGLSLLFSTKAAAQEKAVVQEAVLPDTAHVYEMERVVVTADRTAQRLARSTAAVSVVPGEVLRRQPIASLADAMRLVPGFVFLSLDGLGYAPQPTVRGFYGGGEAGYVQLLVNGKPLNGLERGAINWHLVAPERIDAIEVLRGGASSLYGDAAIGGVINLVIEEASGPSTSFGLQGGSYGTWAGRLHHSGQWANRSYAVYGHVERTGGYREHAARRMGSLGGSIELLSTLEHTLKLSVLNHWRRLERPGPLSAAALDSARRQVAPFYRFDHTSGRLHQVMLDEEVRLSETAHLSSYLSGRLRRVEKIRTLVLTPGFADTHSRLLETARLQGSTQLTLDPLPLPVRSDLTVGLDGSIGTIMSRFYGVLKGPEAAYRAASDPERGELADQGEGARNTFAAFFQYDVFPAERLRLSVGARFDWLWDAFRSTAPEEGERTENTHTAFSPKLGINYRYVEGKRHVGNVYANVSRVFKAPTLDQFYAQRLVVLPGQDVELSNPRLDPQRGVSYEVGVYQRSTLVPGVLSLEGSLAVYQINMRDEIDFSLRKLSYINRGKSRHRGVEAGLKVYLPAKVRAFVNYTHQAVTLQQGKFAGNYVKAIPRNAFNAGFSAALGAGLSGSVLVSGAYDIYLDDANTIPLPGHTRVDVRLAYQHGAATVEAEVYNLLDATYSTTGYPDPSGQTSTVYYYPAAPRTLRLGLSLTL